MPIVERFGGFTYYQDADNVIYAPSGLVEDLKKSKYKCIFFIPGAIVYMPRCSSVLFKKLSSGGAVLEIDGDKMLITPGGVPLFIGSAMKNYDFISTAIEKVVSKYGSEIFPLMIYHNRSVYVSVPAQRLFYISDRKVGVFPVNREDGMYKHVITPEGESVKRFITGTFPHRIVVDGKDVAVSINDELLLTVSDVFDAVVDEIVFEEYGAPEVDVLKLVRYGGVYSKIATVREISNDEVELCTPAGHFRLDRKRPDPLELYAAKKLLAGGIMQLGSADGNSIVYMKKRPHAIYARVRGKVLWKDYSEKRAVFVRGKLKIIRGVFFYDSIMITSPKLVEKILAVKDPEKYVYPGFPDARKNFDPRTHTYATRDRVFYFSMKHRDDYAEINVPFIEGLYNVRIPYDIELNIDEHISVNTLPESVARTPIVEAYPPKNFCKIAGGIDYIAFQLPKKTCIVAGADAFLLATGFSFTVPGKYYTQIKNYILGEGLGREFSMDVYDQIIHLIDEGYSVKDISTFM